ncbi:MAG: hypothetical protein HKN79_11565 [Flavobacteriales bacterium]|nr:hypothetical protein [Flavobacteriales bacterium]
MTKNSGTLVSADEAAKMLQDYLTTHGIDPNKPPAGVWWATFFGIDKMKALITEIDKYNGGDKPNGDIIGVRCYKCESEDSGTPGESVLLIPVTEKEGKKEDIYPIATEKSITQFTPNLILERGVFCPPLCGG